MRLPVFLLLCSVSMPLLADSASFNASDLARPRSGASLMQHRALADVVAAFDKRADSVVVIAHDSSEQASLWAAELRAWLVALGLPSARIELDARTNGNGDDPVIDVSLR